MFKTLDICWEPKGFVGGNPPQELADRVHKIWVDFARDGTAPWPAWDAKTRQVFALEKNQAGIEAATPAERFLP